MLHDSHVDVAASASNQLLMFLGIGDGFFTLQPARFTIPGGTSLLASLLTGGKTFHLVVGNAAPDSVWTFLNTTP